MKKRNAAVARSGSEVVDFPRDSELFCWLSLMSFHTPVAWVTSALMLNPMFTPTFLYF